MSKKVFECPSGDFSCPYYDANGNCMMYPEFDPRKECDDAAYYAEYDDAAYYAQEEED